MRDRHRLRSALSRAQELARQGKVDPAAFAKLAADIDASEARLRLRPSSLPNVSYPPELPVSERKDEIAHRGGRASSRDRLR